MPENSNTYLRPEARAVPYGKHHARARKALDFIIRALKEAAARAKESKHVPNADPIDPNRASRIVFISGEPGSGKSTLYLTLKAMLGNEAVKFREGYKEPSSLDDLKAIRWLDTLDLEVVGDEGENLLAAVLVRIFRKLEDSNLNSTKCENAIKSLEELATDIGIAWEGNLSARAGALDPDTFSTEVMRTQRARLRVNERLKEALDEISTNKCYGCDAETLFLLPVDDFYLKPTASLHLLRLLRMISIPRLFFLVMGDINTVEALFLEKSLADWTTVAGTKLFACRPDRLDDALSRARELRARYLRKLLPPGQRADIEAMDWHEALKFEVGSANHTLQKTLEAVTLDLPINKPESLLSFLISPDFASANNVEVDEKADQKQQHEQLDQSEQPRDVELRKHRSVYTALQILDATPREIMDLNTSLREVVRVQKELKSGQVKNIGGFDQETPVLLLSVRDTVRYVSEEQSFLNEHQQKILEAVLPTRHYSPQKEDITFEIDNLCLRPAARKWNKKEKNSVHLWFRKHRSWDLGANDQHNDDCRNGDTDSEKNEVSTNGQNPFAKLPPRPAAWFILMHDLAWKWNPESLSVNLIEKLCKDLNRWAISVERVKERPNNDRCWPFPELRQDTTTAPSQYFAGWAVYQDKSTYRHLPVPEFQTFREIDQFLYVWSRGLSRAGKSQVDSVISLWALASWTILAGLFEKFAIKGDDWFDDFSGIKKTYSVVSMREIRNTYRKLCNQFRTRFNQKQKEEHQQSSDEPLSDFEYPEDLESRIEDWVRVGSEENQIRGDKTPQ